MSIHQQNDISTAEKRRQLEQIAENWADTPFGEIAEALLADIDGGDD